MIRAATPDDVPVLAELIRALAEYEKLSHEAAFDVDDLRVALFGDRPYAEVFIAESGDEIAGFALFGLYRAFYLPETLAQGPFCLVP